MNRNEEIKKVSELLYNNYIGKGWKNVSLEGCERQAINYIDVRDLVKKLTIADVIVPKGTLCGCGAELIKDVVGIDYCGNTLWKHK